MRGRKKLPNSERLLRGENRPSQLNPSEPNPPEPSSIEAPSDLKGAGRTLWNELVSSMVELGMLKSTDMALFHQHCRTVDEIETWERKAQRRRDLDSRLSIVRLINVLKARSIREAAELGMSPTSRNRVVAKPKPKGNKLAVFIGEKTTDGQQ